MVVVIGDVLNEGATEQRLRRQLECIKRRGGVLAGTNLLAPCGPSTVGIIDCDKLQAKYGMPAMNDELRVLVDVEFQNTGFGIIVKAGFENPILTETNMISGKACKSHNLLHCSDRISVFC